MGLIDAAEHLYERLADRFGELTAFAIILLAPAIAAALFAAFWTLSIVVTLATFIVVAVLWLTVLIVVALYTGAI